MVAPPTHGTMVAYLALGTDVWEHWIVRRHGWPWARFRDSIVDGLGEAATDLCPGSDFLLELNARPRNPNVGYTILLGTGGVMTEEEMHWIRESLRSTIGRLPGAGDSSQQLDNFLAQMDEVIQGKGDGVVAVSRGELAGVEDLVVLPFGHLGVTRRAESSVLHQVHEVILERLD